MIDLDCYLYIDHSVPESERTIGVLCTECHKEKKPDSGFFYQGSKEGYSNYDWQCDICKKYIHKANDDQDDQDDQENIQNEIN